MKRLFLLLFSILSAGFLSAQTIQAEQVEKDKFPFSIKVQPFTGNYLDKNHHFEKFNLTGLSGAHLGLEFPSTQQRPWQQYLNNPTVGLGLTYMDFGHDMLGSAVSLYPYILIDAIRIKHFEMKFKFASGLAFVSEHWYTQEDTNPDHYYELTTNTIFGCYLNVYLNAGLNINIPVTRYFALNGEVGYFHMSNGRTCMPNIGANILYCGVGASATFNSDAKKEPLHFEDLPYKWSLNITGSAGAHKAAIADPNRFLISSFHTGAVYQVNNWYGVGAGMDVFYNGAIDEDTDRSLYRKGRDYTTADKIRMGVALNNEFKFGMLTAIVDWGVYLYNPSRNYYDNDHPIYGYGKRPLFYKNDGAGTDEAFHYIRFGLKCRVWDNLYLQASAKTHLHICEYIEFGVGYQLPFLRKDKRNDGGSRIYHHGN